MMARQDGADAASGRNHRQAMGLVWAAYALLADGNIAGLGPLLADQAVAHEYDGAGHCATYRGRYVILKRLEDLAPSYWDAVRIQVHAVAAAGLLTAAIATWQGTSRASGQSYTLRHVLVAQTTKRHVTHLWFIRDAPEHQHTILGLP